MTTDERIKTLATNLSRGTISRDDTLRELDELKLAFDDRQLAGTGNYTGKIGEARTWADIYFSDRKSSQYDENGMSGRQKVKGFLLNDLATAAQIAKNLQGG
ncbi:hypothetical protein [Bradyrhizobium septentrionale]|uniref:Uncharacterized protein n=1 Tax=Bradyrhizobium septentrionale TaxID=1404411 RepID=A0ABZ2NSM1_9BRAD